MRRERTKAERDRFRWLAMWDPRGHGFVRIWPTLPPLALRQPGAPTLADVELAKRFARKVAEAVACLEARKRPASP